MSSAWKIERINCFSDLSFKNSEASGSEIFGIGFELGVKSKWNLFQILSSRFEKRFNWFENTVFMDLVDEIGPFIVWQERVIQLLTCLNYVNRNRWLFSTWVHVCKMPPTALESRNSSLEATKASPKLRSSC